MLLCTSAFTLQACGAGDTGPAPKAVKLANADSTAGQLQAVTAPFETDAFQNFAVLHQHFGPAGFGQVATVSSTAAAAVPSRPVLTGLMSTAAAMIVWRGVL